MLMRIVNNFKDLIIISFSTNNNFLAGNLFSIDTFCDILEIGQDIYQWEGVSEGECISVKVIFKIKEASTLKR